MPPGGCQKQHVVVGEPATDVASGGAVQGGVETGEEFQGCVSHMVPPFTLLRLRPTNSPLIVLSSMSGIMSEMKPQILVADDDTMIAASLRRALIYEGYDVVVAHDGREALDAARVRQPDLVVLDVMMPEVDGIEVCRRLRADGDVPVLMLTAKDTVADRVLGLDAGADDYLVKPFAYDELLARVRSLLRRREPGSREMLRCADLVVDVDAFDVRRAGDRIELTTLEFHLLEYFMRNVRIVLSRSRILEGVWGLDVDTTSNVVDVYVRYLRNKTEMGGHARLIHTVRGAGYIMRDDG